MSNLIIEELKGRLIDQQYIYSDALGALDDLVYTVIRYINGESSKERLESYIRLNYPEQSKKLK